MRDEIMNFVFHPSSFHTNALAGLLFFQCIKDSGGSQNFYPLIFL